METPTIQSIAKTIVDGQRKAQTPIREAKNFYSEELSNGLKELGDIAKHINLIEVTTPVNYIEARDKWLKSARAGKPMEPRFLYDPKLLTKISDMRPWFEALESETNEWLNQRLESEKTPPEEIALLKMFKSRRTAVGNALDLANRMLSINNYTLSTVVTDIYGTATTRKEADALAKELRQGGGMDFAKDLSHVETGKQLRAVSVDAKGIQAAFLWAAERCGFSGTRPVIIEPTVSSIDVRDTSSKGPMVIIPEDRKVNGLKLLQLISHEILCHWRDSENAQILLPGIGGGALKAFDEVLYEGHAMIRDHDIYMKYDGKAGKLARPYYVIAEDMAMHDGASFSELAHEIYYLILPEGQTSDCDEDVLRETWKTCYRTFRGSSGHNDKLHSYAFTKDRAYFEGMILANELKKAHQEHLLNLGTLSPEDLAKLAAVFKIEKDDFKYPEREDLIDELADKIIAGDFTAVQ